MTGDIVTCDACGQDWPMGSDQVTWHPGMGVWFCRDETECMERSIVSD